MDRVPSIIVIPLVLRLEVCSKQEILKSLRKTACYAAILTSQTHTTGKNSSFQTKKVGDF